MKVLLTPVGTVGDVNPMLGIAHELVARGHRVTFIANPFFEQRILQAPVDFVPVGRVEDQRELEHLQDAARQSTGWQCWWERLVFRPLREQYDAVRRHYAPGETVVAGPGMAVGARLASEKLATPMATMHVNPHHLRSLYESPSMPPMWLADWMPRIAKRSQLWLADKLVIDRYLAPRINTARDEFGLPPVSRILGDWYHAPHLTIGLFPAWWGRPQPDWPRQVKLTGFPLWDRTGEAQLPGEIERFLSRDDRPIVFFAGTNRHHARGFFEAACEACELLGRRGLLITKHRDLLPGELPAGVQFVEFAPFTLLLPRAAALVHHAGIGTTSQGLAAGIPHVAMPTDWGPPDTADRLVRLGVGAKILPKRFRGPVLARALDRLLQSVQVAERCRKIADYFQGANPLEETCDLLESLAGHTANTKTRSTNLTSTTT